MNGRPWAALVVGALLVLLGIAWLLAAADVYELDVRVALGAVLVVIGLAVMLLPRGHGVLVVLAIPLLLVGVLFVAVDPERLDGGVGEERNTPESVSELEDEYELGIGNLVVDLTGVEFDEDVELKASLGIGELVVELPSDVGVDVQAEVGMGNMDVLGEQRDGIGVDLDVQEDAVLGAGTLELELDVGIGDLKVRRR